MGIQGLLPLLGSIQKYAHLRDFAGQRLGIDAYGWLHRGTFTCATELAQGKPCRAYVDFALSRVRMLQHFGVTPYLVFDGARLPSKAHTEKDRSERRKEGRRKGLALLEAGKQALAYQELQKSIDVTPQMARNLIEELRNAGVEYVVAPYEADSQLAYLERRGIIAGILSEDSDLLVFGANVLITKLDQYGECVVYQRSDFTKCTEISLVNWSDDQFRMMAILSGCDYLSGVPGIGLKSAYRLVRQHKSIERVVRTLQFDGKKKVPTDYLQAFRNADRTFLYQWVYCPEAQGIVNLNALPNGLDVADMPYIGEQVESVLATGVAQGDLHPSTRAPLKSTLTSTQWKKKQTSVQHTPDLKPGRSISEFFKPVRTPLAELDPNSFTPSPSQQRLLNGQRGRAWSARSAPSREHTSVRAAMQVSTPQSAPRTSLAQTLKSLKQPAKKERLCADTAAEVTERPRDLQATSSPYFASAIAPKSKANKSASTFELFSDDSICDALQSTTETVEKEYISSQHAIKEQSPRKRKRFEVLREDQEKRRSLSGASLPEIPSTRSQSFSSILQSQSSFLTTTTTTTTTMSSLPSNSQHERDASVTAYEKQSRQWLYDLKVPTKWTYAGRSNSAAIHSQHNQSAFKRVDCDTPHSPSLAASVDAQIPCSSPVHSPSPELNDRDAEEPTVVDAEDAHYGTSVSRHSSSTSKTGDDGGLLGSEDFLVPQSPGSEDDGRLRPKFNLGHFTFAR